MIYEVKDGDFVVLPKKLKMNGVNFDIIGIQEDQLVFADSDRYYINGKLLVEYASKPRTNQCNADSRYFKMDNIVMTEYKIDKNNLYDFRKEDKEKLLKEIKNNKSLNKMSEIFGEAVDNYIDHK